MNLKGKATKRTDTDRQAGRASICFLVAATAGLGQAESQESGSQPESPMGGRDTSIEPSPATPAPNCCQRKAGSERDSNLGTPAGGAGATPAVPNTNSRVTPCILFLF